MQKLLQNSKEKNSIAWFEETLEKSGFVDLTSVPGCIVYRQDCFSIWEIIQEFLDAKLRALGYGNVYFPMFIPHSLMQKEPEHFRVFESELATVTHVGNTPLQEKLVIRPTSEAIMYDSFPKWIKSHHDLPILINQFCSVVRWETKKKNVPLIRGNEFLWQESHSVHATEKETDYYVKKVLDIYKELSEDHLALPFFEGVKPEHRKFPGAKYTLAIESLMPDGKAIQMATSHNLGKNFSRALNIKFEGKKGGKDFVWQASNGCTTRLIGAMLLFHGDDFGFVLPPKAAGTQIVFLGKAEKNLVKKLESKGFRVKVDLRKNVSSEKKKAEYALKGVPLIVSASKGKFRVLIRDSLEEKTTSPVSFPSFAQKELSAMQSRLLSKGKKFVKEHSFRVSDKKDFSEKLSGRKGMILADWCGEKTCAKQVKNDTSGSLRIILKGVEHKDRKCVYCGNKSKFEAFFSEAY